MIKAVFFDCDGVLVDSERLHQQLNGEFVRKYHLGIDPEEFYIMVGSSRQMNLWPRIYEKLTTDWTIEEFIENLRLYKAERMKNSTFADILFPDVPPALEYLKGRGMKIACASSSAADYIQRMMDQCGIGAYFDLAVTGLDFEKSKPAPDIYLYCREKFGLKSEECLVIEDSPYGIDAALAAGMPVLARRDTLFGMDQSRATRIIDSLQEIPAFLEEG